MHEKLGIICFKRMNGMFNVVFWQKIAFLKPKNNIFFFVIFYEKMNMLMNFKEIILEIYLGKLVDFKLIILKTLEGFVRL